MNTIKTARRTLIGAIVGVILLFVFGEATFTYVRRSGWDTYSPSSTFFSSVVVDPHGQVWAVRSWDNGFVIFDGNKWREQSSPLKNKNIEAIAFDHKGQTWIGYSDGVVGVLNGEVWINSGLNNGRLETILVDQKDRVWVGTDHGVDVFDGNGWQSYSQSTAQSPGAGVVDVALDSLGQMWLGLRGGNYSECFGQAITQGGKFASGMSMYDGKGWTNYSWKQMGLKGPYTIQSIAVDKKDQIWVGTNGGLHVFDGELWKTVFEETRPFDSVGPSGDKCIEDIAVDPQGNVWIIMGGGRLGIFDGEKWLRLDDRSVNIPYSSESLAFDQSGRAWIASSWEGLRTTSTARLPIVPSGLLNARYGFTLILGVSFWMLLGLAGVVGSNKQDSTSIILRGVTLQARIRNASRYIIFGSVIGLVVALIGGILHDFLWLMSTFPDFHFHKNFNYWPTYSFYAGPIAGALVGFILGLTVSFHDESVPKRRIGIVIGAITGAWYGIAQVIANSHLGLADPSINTDGVLVPILVFSTLQALIGMLFGYLGSSLFLRKTKSPLSV